MEDTFYRSDGCHHHDLVTEIFESQGENILGQVVRAQMKKTLCQGCGTESRLFVKALPVEL